MASLELESGSRGCRGYFLFPLFFNSPFLQFLLCCTCQYSLFQFGARHLADRPKSAQEGQNWQGLMQGRTQGGGRGGAIPPPLQSWVNPQLSLGMSRFPGIDVFYSSSRTIYIIVLCHHPHHHHQQHHSYCYIISNLGPSLPPHKDSACMLGRRTYFVYVF